MTLYLPVTPSVAELRYRYCTVDTRSFQAGANEGQEEGPGAGHGLLGFTWTRSILKRGPGCLKVFFRAYGAQSPKKMRLRRVFSVRYFVTLPFLVLFRHLPNSLFF